MCAAVRACEGVYVCVAPGVLGKGCPGHDVSLCVCVCRIVCVQLCVRVRESTCVWLLVCWGRGGWVVM